MIDAHQVRGGTLVAGGDVCQVVLLYLIEEFEVHEGVELAVGQMPAAATGKVRAGVVFAEVEFHAAQIIRGPIVREPRVAHQPPFDVFVFVRGCTAALYKLNVQWPVGRNSPAFAPRSRFAKLGLSIPARNVRLSMTEIWLRTNARALWFAMVLPGACALLGLVLVTGWADAAPRLWVRLLGAGLLLVDSLVVIAFVRLLSLPRLSYQDRWLTVYLSARGVRVPIEIVEGFLLGQGPSLLPGRKHQGTETTTVVIRLAESAEEWSHMDVRPALGKWCDGYITIRGTWCEPLNVEVVNRLNRRLAEVQAELRPAGSDG